MPALAPVDNPEGSSGELVAVTKGLVVLAVGVRLGVAEVLALDATANVIVLLELEAATLPLIAFTSSRRH